MIQCPHCRGSGTLSRSWSGGIEAYPCFYCAKPADTIPRATLVTALRELAAETESTFGGSSNSAQFQADCYRCLADEIERGEWPETKRER